MVSYRWLGFLDRDTLTEGGRSHAPIQLRRQRVTWPNFYMIDLPLSSLAHCCEVSSLSALLISQIDSFVLF